MLHKYVTYLSLLLFPRVDDVVVDITYQVLVFL